MVSRLSLATTPVINPQQPSTPAIKCQADKLVLHRFPATHPIQVLNPKPVNENIVYAATHAWNSPIRVGSHHIARHFSRNSDLLYLGHPISLGSILSRADNQLASRWQLLKRGPNAVHTPPGMLEMNTFMPFAPGPSLLQRNSLSNRFGWKLSLPRVLRKIREAGFFQPDLLWLETGPSSVHRWW